MKVAFSGASGSGKTTLVKHVSKELNLDWLNGSSGTIKEHFDVERLKINHGYVENQGHKYVIAKSHNEPEFGKDFQKAVLEGRDKLITENDDFVTDRSPLDNWIYYLLQVGPYSNNEETKLFYNKCLSAFNKLSHVIVLPFLFDEVEDNGSRVANVHYQKMVSHLFVEYRTHFRIMCPNPRMICLREKDLDFRKNQVINFITR